MESFGKRGVVVFPLEYREDSLFWTVVVMEAIDQGYDFLVEAGHSIDKATIKKVQNRLLSMVDIIIPILERNEIPYMVAFGTLLGSVRHKGFIPWDDDFDLFIFDEVYDEAMEVLRCGLPDWMIVHDDKNDPIYWPFWSRVRDLHSETVCELFPNDNKYKYRGICVDLYRLERVDRDDVKQHIARRKLAHYDNAAKIGNISEREHEEKTLALRNELKQHEEHAVNARHDMVYSFLDYCPVVEEDTIFPLKRFEFEGRELLGPHDASAVLEQLYGGDYMAPPPFEMRKPHYSEVVFLDEA